MIWWLHPIFAMATGTGKTITSLNCALESYKVEGYYQIIILVPYKVLVDQWIDEAREFNFGNIISISSQNRRWRAEMSRLQTLLMVKPKTPFVIVSTYDSLQTSSAMSGLRKLSSDAILIADEAHNAGAARTRESLSQLPLSLDLRVS